MFLKYGNYLDDVPKGNINKTVPLFINSCGTYKLSNDTKMTTERPDGRYDYQLIYIASGCGTFFFEKDTPTTIDEGNIVIYLPDEMQKYVYDGNYNTEIYWIHFSGNDPASILEKCGISPATKSLFVGRNPEYNHIFEKIIFELQGKKHFIQNLQPYFFMNF